MPDTIAPVLPMRPQAARTRKPNRRPGSCPSPSKVTCLRDRQISVLSDQAVAFGDLAMSRGAEFAAEVETDIRLSLLEAPASCPPPPTSLPRAPREGTSSAS